MDLTTILQAGIKPGYSSIDKLRIKLFNIDALMGLIFPFASIFVTSYFKTIDTSISIGAIAFFLISTICYLLNRNYYHNLAGLTYLLSTYTIILLLIFALGSNSNIQLYFIGICISAFIYKFDKAYTSYVIFSLFLISFIISESIDSTPLLLTEIPEYSKAISITVACIFGYKVFFLAALLQVSIKEITLSEKKYRQIFNIDTLGVMEQDVSVYKEWARDLQKQGITTLGDSIVDSEEFFRELLGKLKILDINDTFLEIVAAKNKDHYFQNILSTVTEEGVQLEIEKAKAIFNQKASISSEIPIYDLNGNKKYLWINLSLPTEPDNPYSIITFIDITQKKIVEDMLKKSEEKYRSIFENNIVGIALTDQDFRFNSYNHEILRVSGYSVSELNELPLEETISAEFLEEFIQIREKIMRRELNSVRTEIEYITKDGTKIYSITSIIGLYDNNGQFRSAVMTIQDISQQKHQKKIIEKNVEELNRKNHELQKYIESNLQLENFAYIASHDLREPLLTTMGFTRQMKYRYEDQLDEKGKMIVNQIIRATENMNEQIKMLLIYSQVHNNNNQVFEEFDVRETIEEVKSELQSLIYKNQGIVEIEFESCIIEANRYMIKQLIQNLVSNALKFYREGVPPVVKIDAENGNGYWTFSVSDNGIGVDPEYHDSIFILFKRLYNKHKFKGYGMGLAICKKIIEKHEGKIWLASEKGKGTTFYFTIPFRHEKSYESFSLS